MILQQTDSTSAVNDSLSQVFAEKWAPEVATESPVIEAMASGDLIFIVLGVTLIIWFVLLTFLIRLDRRISRLEAGPAKTTDPT